MAAATGNKNYFARHWWGELSIAQAYWTNTVGINLLLGMVIGILGATSYLLPLVLVPFLIGMIWLSACLILVWQSVGVVRSALRCHDDDEQILVPALALVALAVIWLNSGFAIASAGVPQLTDAWNLLRGDRQWPDPVVTLLPSGKEIEFRGAIKLHSAAKLEQALNEHPTARILHLDTPGGREQEAFAMAELVRRRSLATYVSQQCASAGIIVFLAGKERVLRDNARLGFHSARAPGVPTDRANARLEHLLTDAGADSAFVERAVTTPSESIWYPPPRELEDEGLATRVSDGSGFSLGTKEMARYDPQGLEEELCKFRRYQALAQKEPQLFKLTVAHAVDLIRTGADLGTSLRETKKLAHQTMLNSLPFASEAALNAFVEFNLEALRRNMHQNPRETLYFLRKQGVISASSSTSKQTIPDYPEEAADRLVAAIIASPMAPVANDEPDPSAGRVMSLFSNRLKTREEQALIHKIPEERAEQIQACEGWHRFFVELKKSPSEDGQVLERYLLTNAIRAGL